MNPRSLFWFFFLASTAQGVSLNFAKKSRGLLKRTSPLPYRKSLLSPRNLNNRTSTPKAKRTSPPRLFLKAKKRSSYDVTATMRRNRPATSTLRRAPTTTIPAGKRELDTRPTPQPTGPSSITTTVHISDEDDFSLIVPSRYGQKVSDAEADGISQCQSPTGNCTPLPQGFVTAAKYAAADDGSWVQVTGCINPNMFPGMNPGDEGGQFDVRYPNGAQCSFGGYGASFIELLEPATNRFCIRCCSTENDQVNCNSHMDRQGCLNAIPGTYEFPDVGVSCG